MPRGRAGCMIEKGTVALSGERNFFLRPCQVEVEEVTCAFSVYSTVLPTLGRLENE